MKSNAVLGAALLAFATQAGAVTLTFEGLTPGTTLSNQYAALGVVFSANAFTGAGSSSSGLAWATNTDMTIASTGSGGDVGTLGEPALVSGNILHSESGHMGEDGDPSFLMSFSTPVSSISATFAGVSRFADVTMWAYNDNTLLGSVSGQSTGQFVLSFSAASITSVAVRHGSFLDWVGVDDITFAPVPEPASWGLMLLGAAALLGRLRHP